MDWLRWPSWPRPWWLPAPTTWVAVDRADKVDRVVAKAAVGASASKLAVAAAGKWEVAPAAVGVEKWEVAPAAVEGRWEAVRLVVVAKAAPVG